MSGGERINDITTGSLLPLSERERQELLEDVDRQVAEIEGRQDPEKGSRESG